MPCATTLRAVPSTTRDAVFRPQPERAKRVEVGASQSPCAPTSAYALVTVTAAWGHLRRCRSSPIRTVSRRRAALDLPGTHRRWVRRS